MKIRNISTYIEHRGFTEELSKLGTSEEPFLRIVQGDEPNVDTIIEGNASFAQNAEEQLFYEFVQNAYDANAEDLFFFANEDFLIILNNGKPFYTDTIKQSNGKYKEGQLYNFLARGKSQKHGDKNLMGNYGQGSKLLYTLLCDVGDLRTNEEQLSQKIKQEKKGPYLISWASKRQLDNILYGQRSWEYIDPNDIENGALICKIVMGYYPMMPGIDEAYFCKSELDSAISSFVDLVDPKRSENRLKQGTALIVPLGSGQCDRISSAQNLDKVELGLTGFTSLISSSDKYKEANTKNITVLGRNVTPHKGENITVEVPIEGTYPQVYSFVFSRDFAISNYVSLYKWLPITTTRYGLGFLIDSLSFDIDDSRQRITNPEKVLTQLSNAFSILANQLVDIRNRAPRLFTEIYNSIIWSKVPASEDYKLIRLPFEDNIIPFIKRNIRTIDGEYLPIDSVYMLLDSKWNFVNLQGLSIDSKHWVDTDVVEHYQSLNIELKRLLPDEIASIANEDKLKIFVQTLSKDNYRLWHEYFRSITIQNVSLRRKPLFKTNKGRVVSYDDIYNVKTEVFFYDDAIISNRPAYTCTSEIEYIIEPLNRISEIEAKVLFSKLKNHLSLFRSSDALKESCALLLTALVSQKLISKADARSIPLLKNVNGEYTSFSQLFDCRPSDVSILDKFVVKGYKPICIPNDWFVNDQASIWNWVVKNFASIKRLSDWSENVSQYVQDLEVLYSAAGGGNPNIRIDSVLLSLDNEGVPSDIETKFLKNFSKAITLEDYEIIEKAFPNINFTPYRFHRILDKRVFGGLERSLTARDLIDEDVEYPYEVVSVLFKLDSGILSHYWIEKTSSRYIFHHSNPPKNYILSDTERHADKIHRLLSECGYHSVPNSINELIEDKSVYAVENQLIQIISDCSDPRYLFHLVKKMSNDVKEKFLNCLPIININQKIEEDSIDWQIIKFVINNNSDDDAKANFCAILRDKLSVDGQALPDTVQPRLVVVNDYEYDVYRLLSDVKENNEIVEAITRYLPDPETFLKTLMTSSEPWTPEDVYNEINPQGEYLTIEQLEFCVDCCINLKGYDYDTHELKETESISAMLEVVSFRQFRQFDKFWKIPGFNKELQFFAKKDLLLEEEVLPEDIFNWLSADKNRLELISGLKSDDSPYIKLRNALEQRESYHFPFLLSKRNDALANTICWIINQKYSIAWQSKSFDTLRAFIEKLPGDCRNIPVMRYTGECETFKDEKAMDHYTPIFEVKFLQEDGAFLNEANTERIGRYLFRHGDFKDFISKNDLNYPIHVEIKNRLKINNSIWTISQQASLSDSEKEWTDRIYETWKESHHISVYLSTTPVLSGLTITSDGKELFNENIESKDYGYKINKFVVLFTSSASSRDVLSLLKSVAEAQEWFRKPFIELQSMHLEWYEQLKDDAEKQGVNLEQLVKNAQENSQKGSTSGGNSNVDLTESKLSEEDAQTLVNAIKDPDTIEAIAKIADEFTKEELDQISENAELVKEAMQNPDEPESKVRQIIGYIGELIFKHYLEDKLKVNYEFSADQGEGRYDFIVHSDRSEGDRLYVDVKTNLYSFEDGNYAFHLHRAQNKFIHDNPDAQFRIVRISLKDLKLKKSYERLVKLLGKDTDPREDPSVRKKCEEIASNYWKRAQIEQFESLSPQYKLAISQVR